MRIRTVRDVGAAARVRRAKLGMSQQSLADQAGVTREWVVRFESGKVSVALNRVFDVLSVLGLTMELHEDVRDGE
jgi:predicted transcriptional regulator